MLRQKQHTINFFKNFSKNFQKLLTKVKRYDIIYILNKSKVGKLIWTI